MHPVFDREYEPQIGKTDHMTWCDSHVASNYHGKPADKYPLFLTDLERGWRIQSLHIMELYSAWQVWSAAGGGRGLNSWRDG